MEEEDEEMQDKDKQQKKLNSISVDAEHDLSILSYQTLRSIRTMCEWIC